MAKSTSDKSQNTKNTAKAGTKSAAKTTAKSTAKTGTKTAAKTGTKSTAKNTARNDEKAAAKNAAKTAAKDAAISDALSSSALEPSGEPSVDFKDPKYYTNRELSWLDFNYRILDEARDKTNPLFERLKFLSITASNLDEFFMVRVASLKDMVHANYTKPDLAGLTAEQQLSRVEQKCHELIDKQYSTLIRSLAPALKAENLILITDFEDLSQKQKEYVDSYFMENVYPVLTPTAFDTSRPFPLIRNKSLNIGALISTRKNEGDKKNSAGFTFAMNLQKNGEKIGQQVLSIEGIDPGESKKVKINVADADSVQFRFSGFGEGIAWDQFTKPFVPSKAPAVSEANRLSAHPFRINLWRAPTDNDRGWGMPSICAVWRDATASQKMPAGVKSDLKVFNLEDGSKLVDWTLVVPKGLPPIPRVGLSFAIPALGNGDVSWYGLGPWENYSDRATAALLGIHTATVGLARGYANEKGAISYPPTPLNPDNYVEPGEQGYRTGCRWAKVGGAEITAVNMPFGFNAWPYPQTMLEGKAHQTDLSETGIITINVDAVQMGVGGDDSWSQNARPHAKYMPGAGTYRLVFTVKGI